MIRFSNGHEVEFFAASGSLGFDGRGWPWERWFLPKSRFDPSLFCAVLKTITLPPNRGNGWLKVRPIFGVDFRDKKPRKRLIGWANALGLPNPGYDAWEKKYAPRINFDNQVVLSLAGIASTAEGRIKEICIMLEGSNKYDFTAIELNFSCSNKGEDPSKNAEEIIQTCSQARNHTARPLIAKLSVVHPYRSLAKELEGLAEAISINSAPWGARFLFKESPLAEYGGGAVSGKVAQQMTWLMVQDLVRASLIPVIGSSVWDYEDIDELFALGAKAVSFGSVFIAYPRWPTWAVKKWREEHQKP